MLAPARQHSHGSRRPGGDTRTPTLRPSQSDLVLDAIERALHERETDAWLVRHGDRGSRNMNNDAGNPCSRSTTTPSGGPASRKTRILSASSVRTDVTGPTVVVSARRGAA